MDSLPVRNCPRLISIVAVLALCSVVALVGCPSEPTSGEFGGDVSPEDDAGNDNVEENDNNQNDGEECEGEAAFELCDEHDAQCGNIDVIDSCDESRTVDCGDCEGPDSCGEGEAESNECGCEPLTDDDCDDEGLFCGTHSDGCGGEIECGVCDREGQHCSEVGSEDEEEYQCTDEACIALECSEIGDDGAQCGQYTDGCGDITNCGECDGDDVCEDGQCVCQFEGVDSFCENSDVECGSLQGIDNCGEERTEYCGGCGLRPCVGGECGIL